LRPIDDFDLDEDLRDDTAGVKNWRDVAMTSTPLVLAPRATVPKKRTFAVQANVGPLLRRRAAVAAARMGLSRASWFMLVVAHAVHDQLGDDMDDLLVGCPRIYQSEPYDVDYRG